MREIYNFLYPYWKKGFIPVLYLIISTVISFFYPLFPKWAIDNVVGKRDYLQLLFLSLAFFFLIIFQSLFSHLNETTFFRFQSNSIFSIQKDLLRRLFQYPLEFFDKTHSGYLIGRIRGDVAGLSYIFSEGLLLMGMDILKAIGGVFILLTLNIKLTLISLLVSPFIVLKIILSKPAIKGVNEKILEEYARLERELSDTLQGIEVLKSFSKEVEGIERTKNALSDFQSIEIKPKLPAFKIPKYNRPFFSNRRGSSILFRNKGNNFRKSIHR